MRRRRFAEELTFMAFPQIRQCMSMDTLLRQPRDTCWVATSYIREQWRICRVFNLEVLEDNSYVVEELVVHNCLHVLTPFVEPLATNEERKRGIIAADLLNHSPAELQRRYRKELSRGKV